MINWGDIPVGTVIPFPFAAYGASGESLTLTGLATTDIEVYKGTSVTQRASDAGFALIDTDGIDIDTRTGIHGFSIDTGDNTDAGFYAVGSLFYVVVDAVTINAQTVRFIAGTFRLVAAESVAGVPEVDLTHVNGAATTATLDTIKAETASILTDTAEIGTAGAGLTNINLPNQTMDIVGNITGNLSGSVGSVTGNVGGSVASVTGLTASNLDATISSRMPTTHLAATAGKLDGVALADTVTTYTGNTKQTADVATLITTVGAAGAGLTAVPWNASWDAEVQSEVDDALVAQRLDELLNADSDIDGLAPPTVGSVFHELMSKTAGSFTFDQTTDSVEALRDRGDAAWITATGFATAANLATAQADLDILTGTDGATLATSQPNYAPAVAGNAMTLTSAYDFAKGTVAMTESYAANGAAPTPVQALFAQHQDMMQFTISGTSKTVRKLDNATTAFVVTLDDSVNPTGAART